MDQNDKLVQYGVTYVLARDGFSGKLVIGAVMHYLACGIKLGVYLLLFMQEKLRVAGRGDHTIAPYVTSTQNHIIERLWVELNHGVTYPIKRVVVSMDQQGAINMDNVICFAASMLCWNDKDD